MPVTDSTVTELSVALRSVRGHAKRLRDAQEARDRAIRAAHRAGGSLRVIADAAGVAHQTVQNIIDRET
jgi:hypothetical protein